MERNRGRIQIQAGSTDGEDRIEAAGLKMGGGLVDVVCVLVQSLRGIRGGRFFERESGGSEAQPISQQARQIRHLATGAKI